MRPSSWQTFAEELAVTSGCRVAIVIYVDHTDPHRSFVVSGGIGDDFDEQLSTRLFHDGDDPYWTAMQTLRPGSVQLGDDIISREAQHRNAYYSHLCKPWSLEHFLLSCITTRDDVSAFLTLGRTDRDPPFQTADKTFVSQQLLTHLQRSLILGRELAVARDGQAQMTAVVDMAPDGIVVFDHNGRVTMD
ncbi:MAG: hypothetical protein R3F24_04055 [Gammaproteobacteria bacterium]